MDVAAGSFLSLVYRVVGIGALAVLTVVIARALPLDDLGVLTTSLVAISAVASIAGSFAGSAGYFVSNQKRPAPEVAANATLVSLGAGLIIMVGALAAWGLYEGEHRQILPLVGIAVFPIIARTALGGVYLGTNALLKYSFSVHGYGFIALALTLVWVVALDHRTAAGALAVWIVAQYGGWLVLAATNLSWWGWMLSHRPSPSLMGRLIAFGAFTGLAGFISYFNYRVDQLLVPSLDSVEGAGLYGAAVRVAEGLWLFSTAIAVAAYASVGSLSRAESSRLTARGVRHTLLIVTSLAIPIMILAPWLLLVFGDQFREAAWALRILCVGTLLYAPQSLLSTYFTVQLGKPWIPLGLACFSLLVSIGVSVVMIPRVGYVGGAWATAISYGITAALSTAIFLARSDATFRDLWRIDRDDINSYFRLGRRVMRKLKAPLAPAPGHGT
jgi:O-antigen/teichoic acid export membrane protein